MSVQHAAIRYTNWIQSLEDALREERMWKYVQNICKAYNKTAQEERDAVIADLPQGRILNIVRNVEDIFDSIYFQHSNDKYRVKFVKETIIRGGCFRK